MRACILSRLVEKSVLQSPSALFVCPNSQWHAASELGDYCGLGLRIGAFGRD